MSENLLMPDMPKKFSQAPFWERQKKYYIEMGSSAWEAGAVPFYATSNGFVAEKYARAISAFHQDCIAKGQSRELVILELGTGHGYFTYLLLAALQRYIPPQDRSFCHYIATDLVQTNLDFCASQPQLSGFVARAQLDFATMDIATMELGQLMHSGVSMESALSGKSCVVIANFIFDVLPFDLYRFRRGKVEEGLATESPSSGGDYSDTGGMTTPKLDLTFEVLGEAAIRDHEFVDLINYYRKHVSDSVVSIPSVSLRATMSICELCSDSLWLIGEEGSSTLESLQDLKKPNLRAMGGLSTRVNLHAVARYFEDHGDTFYIPPVPDPRFDCYAAIFKKTSTDGFENTVASIHELLEGFSPRSYFRLYAATRRSKETLSLDAIIALLELSYFDSHIVDRFYTKLLQLAPQARQFKREGLSSALRRVFENSYQISTKSNLDYKLGRIFHAMSQWEDAHRCLSRAAQSDVRRDKSLFRLGCTYVELGDESAARAALMQALELQPKSQRIKQKLAELA